MTYLTLANLNGFLELKPPAAWPRGFGVRGVQEKRVRLKRHLFYQLSRINGTRPLRTFPSQIRRLGQGGERGERR